MDPHELEQRIVDRWDFEDVAASYHVFSEAADDAGQSSVERLILLTQVARAQGLQRAYIDASITLDSVAEGLATQGSALSETDAHHLRARLAIERGRVLSSSGSHSGAAALFQIAFSEATEAGLTGLAVDALHMSAIVAGRRSQPQRAAEMNARAIAVAESSDDPAARRWLGSLLNNHGWDQHDAGAYEEALKTFRRAVEVRIEQGSPREIAVAQWCVGRCLRSLERYGEALEIQERLAAAPSAGEDGYVFEELGENLMALGRPSEAATYFSRAHELLSDDDWLVDNESERLERLLTLSDD